MAKPQSIIGSGVGRVEGAEKVSGQAVYAADVHFPDALWGKILRSPYPHARIVSIDTSKAWKVEGVKADRHRQGRAQPLPGEKHPRHSMFVLGQGPLYR